MIRGLVVGKFAPLHRGHELVIRRALAECDRVTVISWANPEYPGCEPARRAAWLAELFPSTERLVVESTPDRPTPHASEPDAVQREFVARLCSEVLGVTVDAVYTSEAYGPGFAAHLARRFGRPVRHVAVDPARRAVPISATQIRADVHAHRELLSPVVYASFVERVVVLGGESSGKSTLTRALARALSTAHVEEFGRERFIERGGQLLPSDPLEIGERQVALEEEATRRARRYLFCDTSPLTTLYYARELFGAADPRLVALAERPYHHVVLCAPDIPFEQDGTRRDASFRAAQQAFYAAWLAERGLQPIDARGSLGERVETVVAALARSRR